MLKHGSLFSGIGGFDLAAEWMGWENIFHCELNKFGQRVLKYYWPKAKSYDDITKTDFSIHRGTIDILTGGFPCQPFSTAGKQRGVDDERYLWPEMLRAIRQIQPPYIVGENVPGLVNWSGGMVFEQVQADLENEGYEVTPFILPAASSKAPHERSRIWFIAYCSSYGQQRSEVIKEINYQGISEGMDKGYEFNSLHDNGFTPNANSKGFQKGWIKDMSLTHFMIMDLLPTPTARDFRSGFQEGSEAFLKRMSHSRGVNLHEYLQRLMNGKNFQLNPPYVMEMMGFPPNWTELPFLNLELKALKPVETQ